MILRCQACRDEIEVAPLEWMFVRPVVIAWMVLATNVLVVWDTVAPSRWRVRVERRAGWRHLGRSLLQVLVLAPLLVFGGVLLLCWWPVMTAVYWASSRWECPACGERRWGWPRTGSLSPLP